ncbi:MAG: magnesium transporter, partial [Nitrospirota bacterium]|nr:magnesium transporter [Nitrospirota bacterium]
VIADLSTEDQVIVFRILPRELAAEAFEWVDVSGQERLLKAMGQEELAALLNSMAPDDRTMLLEELPANMTKQLLAHLTPEERAVAVTLLGYPEHSIGRLMTPDYIAVREDWSVQDTLEYIRRHGQDSETLIMVYVVNEQGRLIDDIHIRSLLLAPPVNTISNLMDNQFVALKATDDQETAVTVFKRELRTALPVTDSSGILIGIVTIDDVLRVAEAAATEDIQKIGGSTALDEPYIKIALRRMVQKRAGWLVVLFVGEMFTATAMGFFQKEIEKAVVLALFVPLIISSGGNSGSQASTLVIRALALGEIGLRDWWRVMQREIFTGLALGSILGMIGFLRIAVWSLFADLYGPHWFLVALTVGVSLIGVVMWGALTGSLLPFLLRRLGFDPAASSAPFVATLVDVTGLVIYFSIAFVFLRGTLL